MAGLLNKIFKTKNERELQRLQRTVDEVNALEPAISALSDGALRAKTEEFRKRIDEQTKALFGEMEIIIREIEETSSDEDKRKGKEKLKLCRNRILEPILPEAFAVVREVARRTIGMRHFDVQVMGAKVLHEGNITEMATGEGKTLAATMPLYLNALAGKGCHLITVNDYLARRDREWMGPVYELLGLTVGAIQHDMEPAERQKAYKCDITYGTNNEFGFDYLRDNMVVRKEDRVQRPLNYAIVDEVDSILIDEARTPLIISGPAEESTSVYYTVDKLVRRLKGKFVTEAERIDAKNEDIDLGIGCDYMVDEKHHSAELTEEGMAKCQEGLNLPRLFEDPSQIEVVHHINQALRAHSLYKRDVAYMLKDGQVVIVDEFTGRLMSGRRWSDGLHQAVEAKEGVKIERENQTLATITFQNYFRIYDKLAGMTGTAETEATEFHQIYGLDVVIMPTNRPLIRQENPDIIYKTLEEKFDTVVEEIISLHKQGRPVLVGTISIEKSELLGRMLKSKGISHHVLNARYHEQEAEIVAQAGRLGAVTIATNMAGRGTDIILGGNPKFLAKVRLKQQGFDPEKVSEEAFEEALSKAEKEVSEEHKKVVEAGGLHILGTERHEARRIDNQLRGRAGRQGDPGSSLFCLSLEDDLMRIFASERISGLMERFNWEKGQPLMVGEGALARMLSRTVERAQRQVEAHNFDIRKRLLEYDNIMNRQRQVIYEDRREILEGKSLKDDILSMMEGLIEEIVNEYTGGSVHKEDWDLTGLEERISRLFPFTMSEENINNKAELEEYIAKTARETYESREEEFGLEVMEEFVRHVFLQFTDSKWKDHLYTMDHLREGIGYRAYGEKDPLIEYQHEAFGMFEDLKTKIVEDTIQAIFRLRPVSEGMRGVFLRVPQQLLHPEVAGMEGGKSVSAKRSSSSSDVAPVGPDNLPPVSSQGTTFQRVEKKVGRNDPCSCGSGKKYKKCCGK